jgi:hypothetical protein
MIVYVLKRCHKNKKDPLILFSFKLNLGYAKFHNLSELLHVDGTVFGLGERGYLKVENGQHFIFPNDMKKSQLKSSLIDLVFDLPE